MHMDFFHIHMLIHIPVIWWGRKAIAVMRRSPFSLFGSWVHYSTVYLLNKWVNRYFLFFFTGSFFLMAHFWIKKDSLRRMPQAVFLFSYHGLDPTESHWLSLLFPGKAARAVYFLHGDIGQFPGKQ